MAPPIHTLIEVDLGGDIRRYIHAGTQTVVVNEALGSGPHRYRPGAIALGLPARSAPISGGGDPGGSARLTIWGDLALDLWELRKTAPTQTIVGRLYWWQEGDDYRLRKEIHRGFFRAPTFEHGYNVPARVTVTLSPPQRKADIVFPPTSIGDQGRFPDAPDVSKPQAIPVLYGNARGVPVYAVSDITVGGAFPVRMLVAGHRIVSTTLNVMDSDGGLVVATPVYEDFDGLGGFYSYVNVLKGLYAANTSLHVEAVEGKPQPGSPSRAINRLGDVLLDMWHTYNTEDFFELDRSRAETARTILNRYTVGVAFNQRIDTGTLLDAMSSRFADAFPLAFSYSGGRLGWDATRLPDADIQPAWEIVYREDAYERSPVTETSADEVRHIFVMQYGYDGYQAGETQSLTLDESNFGAARRALSRWGKAPRVRFRSPDVHTESEAYALLVDKAQVLVGVRQTVTYSGLDRSFNDLPLMSLGKVTDEDLGWVDEECLIESIQPRLDGLVDVSIITLNAL